MGYSKKKLMQQSGFLKSSNVEFLGALSRCYQIITRWPV